MRPYGYYQIPGVHRTATSHEINLAYRKLARELRPDRNLDPEVQDKFKKVNEAYEVLTKERTAYDNSPEECPNCLTHKVVATLVNHWRCTRCWCQFNGSRKVTEAIGSDQKSKTYVRWSPRIEVFKKTQCSWCELFYTQPFTCPPRKLHSSCFHFSTLSPASRDRHLQGDRWWGRIIDMVYWVENKGVMKWCVCGAANPNP